MTLLTKLPAFLAPLADKFPELYNTALTYPAIDNHAHPLLRASARDVLPFEGLLSEAEGKAMNDAIYTVSARKAAKELAELFGISLEGTTNEEDKWERIKAHRAALEYNELCRVFFAKAGIHTILIDDGLGGGPGGMASKTEGYRWHDTLTAPGRTKRIVRVEVEAEEILRNVFASHSSTPLPTSVLITFEAQLIAHLTTLTDHPDVIGFKSIVCYRTGLDVSLESSEDAMREALDALWNVYHKENGRIRLAHKALNDNVVRIALGVAGEKGIPVQFHTGLGDTDIRLPRSSPAHMQPLIERFPQTRIVILHAAYPYTRDAGYLAAVYKNVFLDFGEVFPFVSSAGQRAVISQVLELTPTNKILWSSDGHWWPESYYLGIYQARLGLFEVLSDLVVREELTQDEAVKVVQDALYNNSVRVYGL